MKKLLVVNLFMVITLTVSYAQTPAGNNQDIQFNNNGSFGGSSYLKWNGSFLSLLDLGTTSAKLYFNSGSGDHSYIYSENFGTNLNRLVIETADDGDQDYTVFRNKHWNDGIKDVFEVRRSWVKANANFYVENGNVGIGTITPNVKLEVKQNSSTDAVGLRLTNSGWASNMSTSIEFKTGYIKSVPTSKISSIMNGSGNAGDRLGFFVQENSDTNPNNNPLEEKLSLLPNGDVGIGSTTSTSARLHIKQSINDATGGIALQDTDGRFIKIYGEGSAGRQVIGTYATVNPLAFELNGVERMRILSNGNLGIGVANPEHRLHVASGARFRKTSISTTGASAENSWIRDDWLTGNYGPPKWDQNLTKWVRRPGTYNDIGGIVFQDEGTYFIRDRAGTQVEYTNQEFLQKAYLFAHIASGNLGIGTITPKSRTHIFNGVSGGNVHIFSDLTVEDDTEGMISILTPNDKMAYYGFADTDDTYVGGMQYNHSNNSMIFRVNDHSVSDLFINSDGDVGIGVTETEGYKLAVKGKIITEEVKVAIYPWSDFVFENDYNLPTLKEVEQHIKEKGHLKDIPSATDVSKNGIFLGEMNAKLLQKIEELTLYTIQQEKVLTKIIEEKEVALKNQKEINKNLEEKLKTQDFRLQKIEALLNTKTKQP